MGREAIGTGVSTLVVALSLTVSAAGQVTNVACVNDYYVDLGGGARHPALGTPCNPAVATLVPGGTTLNLVVGGAPPAGLFPVLVVPVFQVGPCVPKSVCSPLSVCGLPPVGAPCPGNQSIDLAPGFFPGPNAFAVPGACPANASFPLAIPTGFPGVTFSTQAVIYSPGPHCANPPEYVLTEAFNFRIV